MTDEEQCLFDHFADYISDLNIDLQRSLDDLPQALPSGSLMSEQAGAIQHPEWPQGKGRLGVADPLPDNNIRLAIMSDPKMFASVIAL